MGKEALRFGNKMIGSVVVPTLGTGTQEES